MRATLHFECSGCCGAEEHVEVSIKVEFTSFSGRSYGFGTYHYEPRSLRELIDPATPEGWVAFDPYTQVTYCPKCWEEIEAPQQEEPQP